LVFGISSKLYVEDVPTSALTAAALSEEDGDDDSE